jgi:methylmalonyl-CoA/ethylmalonyl-CoA epimerase
LWIASYLVDDVADGLKELQERGELTLDKKPRELMGNRYAFIQPPAKFGGVLTEILDGEFDRNYDKE